MDEKVRVLRNGMEFVVSRLRSMNIDLSKMNALEFGAKDGLGHAPALQKHVGSYEAWEIEESNRISLETNLPGARIVIGDGFDLAKEREREKTTYDLIVFDCPQNIFGREGQYCDHMEALELVRTLMSDEGVVVFNVKTKPYDFDQSPKWQARRNDYYQMKVTANLTLGFVEAFYDLLFYRMDMGIQNRFVVPRPQEPNLFYVVYQLKRRST
jgi:hypothetical protein